MCKKAAYGWLDDHAATMGAAIAYYTVFSLAPMLVMVIGVAGLAFGREAAEGALFGELAELIGPESAVAVQALLRSARSTQWGRSDSFGIVTLIIAAARTASAVGAKRNLEGYGRWEPGRVVSPHMRPAAGLGDPSADERFVTPSVAVGVDDAAKVLQMRLRMLTFTVERVTGPGRQWQRARRMAAHRGRRSTTGPSRSCRAPGARTGAGVSSTCSIAGEDVGGERVDQRLQRRRRRPDPAGQGRESPG